MPLTPNTNTIKFLIESQLRVFNIPMDMKLSDLGAKDFQLSQLNHKLWKAFDKAVSVTFTDSVFTILDKLNK